MSAQAAVKRAKHKEGQSGRSVEYKNHIKKPVTSLSQRELLRGSKMCCLRKINELETRSPLICMVCHPLSCSFVACAFVNVCTSEALMNNFTLYGISEAHFRRPLFCPGSSDKAGYFMWSRCCKVKNSHRDNSFHKMHHLRMSFEVISKVLWHLDCCHLLLLVSARDIRCTTRAFSTVIGWVGATPRGHCQCYIRCHSGSQKPAKCQYVFIHM